MRSSTLSDVVGGGRARGFEPGTRRVGGFSRLPALVRQFGVDPASVLAEAEVDPETLADPSGRISWESFARILRVAAAQTHCPHFGLCAGHDWHLADLGPMSELVRNSPTVGAALQELVVNHHLASEGALIFLRQYDDAVDIGYAAYLPFAENMRHIYDGGIAVMINVTRELCGADWHPSVVFLPHSPPADLEPYREYLRGPLRFDAPFCAARFPATWLARPVVGADAGRLRLARTVMTKVDGAALIDRTQRALRIMLLHGKASGADVAQSLAMHRRTLNRRLKLAGVTFQQVLDRVRYAVAKELLEETDIGLPEIAGALGYANSVSLIPAFRRWTGMTPGAWRDAARQSAKKSK